MRASDNIPRAVVDLAEKLSDKSININVKENYRGTLIAVKNFVEEVVKEYDKNVYSKKIWK